jgi:hypothetical protein
MRANIRLPGRGHVIAVGRDAVLVYDVSGAGARLLRFVVPAFRPSATPKE